MNILDNELVKKYFTCLAVGENHDASDIERCKGRMAMRVLAAMQEPIRKGERYLYWSSKGIREETATSNIEFSGGIYMRLPSQFQKRTNSTALEGSGQVRECVCGCQRQGNCNCHCHQPPRDEVKCNCGISNQDHLRDCAISVEKRNAKIEEKIKEFVKEYQSMFVSNSLIRKLRDLVQLAMENA